MRRGAKGRAIKVRPVVFGEADPYGNASRSFGEPIIVKDVLIAPGDPMGDIEDGRPDGAVVSYTLYVPKGVGASFRGARVEIGGEEFDVVGDPRSWPEELVRGKRNLVVKVARHEG